MARKTTDPLADAKNAAATATSAYTEAIDRILVMRGERLGLPTIAKKLNEEGIKTKTGKEWRPRTVRQILVRNNAMGDPVVARKPKDDSTESAAVTPNAVVVKRGRRSSPKVTPEAA
jgi:hypothetical protein